MFKRNNVLAAKLRVHELHMTRLYVKILNLQVRGCAPPSLAFFFLSF